MEGSGMLSGGMLGSLDIPHHQQQAQQQPPHLPAPANPHYAHQQHHPLPPTQTISFPAVDQGSNQQLYGGYKVKGGPPGSDEDEADEGGGGVGKRSASPWQRMKWTDSMVRLLITVVYYVGGDDGGDGVDKKKPGGGGGGGGGCGGGVLLQKKGKWKSVSMAMMEKGFFVSPQQCEDKFNDLNKRYKRVNDILGRGTACRVVENQSLLETMDHISPKMKEEVRKLLHSKHLFFREMCAYHSSCAQNAHALSASPSAATTHHSDLQHSPAYHPQQQQPGQQGCFHEEENEVDNAAAAMADEDEEDEEDDDDDEDDVETSDRNKALKVGKKRAVATAAMGSGLMQQLREELGKVVEDERKLSPWEQREWLWRRRVEVEEQRVGYQSEALELEKQRFKWVKYSTKKERELERLRLENERHRLEADRMAMLLRRKEMEVELPRMQQAGPLHACSSNVHKWSEPSSLTR